MQNAHRYPAEGIDVARNERAPPRANATISHMGYGQSGTALNTFLQVKTLTAHLTEAFIFPIRDTSVPRCCRRRPHAHHPLRRSGRARALVRPRCCVCERALRLVAARRRLSARPTLPFARPTLPFSRCARALSRTQST
jgi:hypothetical protein